MAEDSLVIEVIGVRATAFKCLQLRADAMVSHVFGHSLQLAYLVDNPVVDSVEQPWYTQHNRWLEQCQVLCQLGDVTRVKAHSDLVADTTNPHESFKHVSQR